MVKKMLNDF